MPILAQRRIFWLAGRFPAGVIFGVNFNYY
jgi:hypothetical protein